MSCYDYVTKLLDKRPLQVDAINTCTDCDNKDDIKLPYLRPTCHSYTVADNILPFYGSDEKFTDVVIEKKTPTAGKEKFVQEIKIIALTKNGAKKPIRPQQTHAWIFYFKLLKILIVNK
jgi:hypothetical protein